nr:MAG TPA: hypothetical protein [Caudoviricetes sp.]
MIVLYIFLSSFFILPALFGRALYCFYNLIIIYVTI